MRIAVVTTSYPRDEEDPSGHFVRAEVRRLAQDGHDVRVLAPREGEALGAFGWPGATARIRERPWRVLGAIAWVARTRVALGRVAADRVICHWAVPSAWPIAESVDAPLEVVSHGGDVRTLRALPARARRAIVRSIVARADRWRFPSEALLGDLAGALDPVSADAVRRVATVAAPPIELPEPGVLTADIARRRDEVGDAAIYVVVARLVRSKRVDAAIDHAARSPVRARLVVVGDGPEREALEERARARGVDARFVGRLARREALAWIGAADALVHASHAEGLSTVVREAEALGVRVERVR